ncbi:UDP-GalNAc:beta-1,3-N-acetylgalactosaminyltransferase 2-like [Dermatophagoides pteronyssinus]|uniref:UDP-GalNAc:beta-1, 3-N-acetylgalactosaminyltransferase 2-like n=1 Tax=Dermatophagoides pteronyssinus TaxID=6956 RepID=UPI003F66A672
MKFLFKLNLLIIVILEKFFLYYFAIPNDLLSIKTERSIHLEIAILSARENFKKRNAIRQTWFQNVKFLNQQFQSNQIPIRIDTHFILGSQSCQIHPLNRKTLYECSELTECDSLSNKSWLFELTTLKSQDNYRPFKGFKIKIYRRILIHRIVIRSSLIRILKTVNVQILNALNKKKLFEFEIKQNENLEDQNFHYVNVNISFEVGSILLFMIDHNVPEAIFDSLSTNNECAMEILRSYDNHINDYESEPFNPNQHRFLLNFEWQLDSNIESNNNSYHHLWQQKMNQLNVQLSNEFNTFGDIIFVDLIDVYRNLAQKLLKFFHHLFQFQKSNITHVLKTDDDCYLNLVQIVRLIMENSDCTFTWFGSFRKQWPINYYGKWMENVWTLPWYPSFACGSGYILTNDLIKWLAINHDKLYAYQGEDVSMGIWMTAINPKKIEDNRWICGTEIETNVDLKQALTVPQLDPEMMFQIHQMFINS